MISRPYRGRFAPTPSGALHFGSLVAALGSYLDARHHHGTWLIRIEDVDRNRSKSAYTRAILHTLAVHGMHSDEPPRIQSEHLCDYEAALTRLTPHLYCCRCTRKDWQAQTRSGALGKIYPRSCRRSPAFPCDGALRLALPDEICRFHDRIHGKCRYALETEIGDPILKRRDGDIAYALAVVVDDAQQHITHIVRGADLLAHTAIQRTLQRLLDYPAPEVAHLPLVLDARGNKMSKQNHAAAIPDDTPSVNLLQALDFLRQNRDGLRADDSPAHILATAARRWNIELLRG